MTSSPDLGEQLWAILRHQVSWSDLSDAQLYSWLIHILIKLDVNYDKDYMDWQDFRLLHLSDQFQ